MLVSWAVGLRRLCEAYGGLRSLFWAAVPCATVLVLAGQQTVAAVEARPRETASSSARALASLPREASRHHRSRSFSIFRGASRKKRAYKAAVFGAAQRCYCEFQRLEALRTPSTYPSNTPVHRIAGRGRHGAYGVLLGLDLQHLNAADRGGLGTRRDRRSLHTQIQKIVKLTSCRAGTA